jgi:lipoprotein-anchoring transpeptidase ErfK/SrfK
MTLSSTHSTSSRSRRLIGALAAAGIALFLLLPAAGAASVRLSGLKHTAEPATSARAFTLTNNKIGHWAPVIRRVAAHSLPKASSHTVTLLSTVTGDGTQNIVLILEGVNVTPTQTWYKVRLPILPNNSTGWVPRSALGNVYVVHTHLYVNRETHTAVLKRNGVTIFATRIGNGTAKDPTPPGQFYIRDKLTDFNDPFYGPVAFGTSARSAVLTDWPGGGFVGVHGTDTPGLIPGYISHGCIRLVNSQILKLAKLLTVGTPLTIT